MSGGKVLLTEGNFDIDVAIDNGGADNIYVAGMGVGATAVRRTAAGLYGFDFGDGATQRNSLSISGMTISATLVKNAGAAIRLNKVFRAKIEDVYIDAPYIGVDLQQTVAVHLEHIYINAPVATNGIGVRIDGAGNDQHLDHVLVAGGAAAEPLAGLQILQTGALHMNC